MQSGFQLFTGSDLVALQHVLDATAIPLRRPAEVNL
jgi:hypothetical protein